jgi:16S rRNA processing protein RimM
VPVQQEEFTLLGKIIKAHGFHGAVVIALEGNISEEIKEMESVFVEIDGKPVPFFFEWVKDSGPESLIVKFEFYNSENSILEFAGCSVYTDRQTVVPQRDSNLPIFLKGYTLLNSNKEELGAIVKILSYPMQVMLELETSNTDEILIPYNEDWIIELDNKNKTLSLDLPEGLDSINK